MIRLKPAVFGYHEVFHLLVMAGVAAHLRAISLFAVPFWLNASR
jgi:predicted membrane channel-forming protein YqfA (hemolysin III family)